MIDQVYRILYCPIAKNACTSLKRSFVDFGSIRLDHDLLAQESIHVILDSGNTGYQLGDLPAVIAEDIILDDAYFSFAVVRDPLERLLSVYREKFVLHRREQAQLRHTGPVTAAIQRCSPEEIDTEKGITFEDFMIYILGSEHMDLDPHWRPQFLYLQGIKYKKIYLDLELDRLAEDIRSFAGKKFPLRQENTSRTVGRERYLEEAYKYSPADLEPMIREISTSSFYNDSYRLKIGDYYSEDCLLVMKTLNSDYNALPKT